MANRNAGDKAISNPQGFGSMPAVNLTPRKSVSPGYPKGPWPNKDGDLGMKRVSAPGVPQMGDYATVRQATKPTRTPDFS